MSTEMSTDAAGRPAQAAPLQVIAMHGWAGEASQWAPWNEAVGPLGWRWCSAERGYGSAAAAMPAWETGRGRRVIVAHSMGPHLLPPPLLAGAEAVVLLASFGRFVPPGRQGRSLEAALAGMAAELEDEARARRMLERFLALAAEPDPVELMRPGPAQGPLSPDNRRRLRHDLHLLAGTRGLPQGFPSHVPLLIVEAADDRIVAPDVRALLRAACPAADVVTLPGTGHALLSAPVIPTVLDWLQASVAPALAPGAIA
jgi:pimeloyl-[acyl-carrier protein] methyl ester esterase